VSEQPLRSDPQPYTALFDKAFSVSAFLALAMQGQAPSKLVCSCFRVTDRQIMHAIEQHGLTSLAGLQGQLKCGSNCGSCLGEVKALLKQTQVNTEEAVTEGEQG